MFACSPKHYPGHMRTLVPSGDAVRCNDARKEVVECGIYLEETQKHEYREGDIEGMPDVGIGARDQSKERCEGKPE